MAKRRSDTVGVTAKDNRLFIEAVLYRYRAGIAWRDLPERFGNFRAIHTRHTRWSRKEVWKRIFEHLAQDSDNEYAMIVALLPGILEHIQAFLADKAYDAQERTSSEPYTWQGPLSFLIEHTP